ncbi:MAG: hypothetical protein OXL98_08170 [Acidimicrobiaceae bacterium]|nr:hypothetical protein [Acidimicrobiaceae bacterium]
MPTAATGSTATTPLSLGGEMGGVCADVHRCHGVGLAHRAERVALPDGSTIGADAVVVGVVAAEF